MSDIIHGGFAWQEGVNVDEAAAVGLQLLLDALTGAGNPEVFRLDITITEEAE